jgi:hypothetical protein
MNEHEAPTCTLRLIAQGRTERCARELCGFWEPGGAVVDGACVIERLGVDVRRPDLAAYLIEVRERLDKARNLRAAEAGHREFSRRTGLEL